MHVRFRSEVNFSFLSFSWIQFMRDILKAPRIESLVGGKRRQFCVTSEVYYRHFIWLLFHAFYTRCYLCINANMICCTGDTFVCTGCAHIWPGLELYCFLRDQAILSFLLRYERWHAWLLIYFCPLCNCAFRLVLLTLQCVCVCASNFCHVVRSLAVFRQEMRRLL